MELKFSTTLSLSPSRTPIEFGLAGIFFFPKSEPDLTVDLNNCVIDVSSRCDLSLATRDTVGLPLKS